MSRSPLPCLLWCRARGALRSAWAGRVLVAFLSVLDLLSGCQSFRLLSQQQPRGQDPSEKTPEVLVSLPSAHALRIAPYVFVSDTEIQADQPLFQEVARLREEVTRALHLPDSQTAVHVYLFEDRPTYERFMQQQRPNLPLRRAFFVAQEHPLGKSKDLLVYTFWGEHTRKDLRHELTHALLHGVIHDVPIWLDEGLAEFFEVPPENKGINPEHLAELQADLDADYRLDLARLERLTEVDQMNRPEYREAWAWVYLMMCGKPEAREVLLDYLKQLRLGKEPGPLRPRLALVHPEPEKALHKLLDTLPAPATDRMRARK
jgi:hypothetical protein